MDEYATPDPVRLRITFGAGEVEIEATDTATSTVRLEPYRDDDASQAALDQTTVEQHGKEIRIETPRKSSLFRRPPRLRARITVPTGSSIEAKLDSADLSASGEYSDVLLKSGSGDLRLDTVTGEASVQSGSGDIDITLASGRTRAETGSGDVAIRTTRGQASVSTGSGDIQLDEVHDAARVNSGSGDILIGDARGDVDVNTASGDQRVGRTHRGRVRCNAASGDIQIGIVDGTAAWLEVNSLSGTVESQLDGSEPPSADEETVQVKVNTVSGDISLIRA